MSELQLYPWQQQTWQKLADIISYNRTPHGMIFHGIQGIGKKHLANYLAKALLCRQRQTDQTPCDQCHSCHMFAAGTHPDLFRLCLSDGTVSIGVDDVRGLTSKLSETAHLSGMQVVICDELTQLTLSAANCLLKTLEEPPGQVVFILVTANLFHVYPTIRSRCQLFALHAGTEGEQWLRDNFSDQDPQQLQSWTQGAPLNAQKLIDEAYSSKREQWFKDLGQLLSSRDNVVAIAQQWQQQPIVLLVDTIFNWTLDMLKLRLVGAETTLFELSFKTTLNDWSQRTKIENLQNYLTKLLEIRHLINARANINLQLILEDLLFAWPVSGQKVTD